MWFRFFPLCLCILQDGSLLLGLCTVGTGVAGVNLVEGQQLVRPWVLLAIHLG